MLVVCVVVVAFQKFVFLFTSNRIQIGWKFYSGPKLACLFIGTKSATGTNGHTDLRNYKFKSTLPVCEVGCNPISTANHVLWTMRNSTWKDSSQQIALSSRQYCFRASRGAEWFVRGLEGRVRSRGRIMLFAPKSFVSWNNFPNDATSKSNKLSQKDCLINLNDLAVR